MAQASNVAQPGATTAAPDLGAEDLVGALFRVIRQVKNLSGPEEHDRANVLVLYHLQGSGPARLSSLAADLGLDVSTVSRQVRSMEAAGLVRRTPDPEDRRACRLEPTATGRDVFARVLARRRRAFAAATADWSDPDRATLVALLARLADDLTKYATLEQPR